MSTYIVGIFLVGCSGVWRYLLTDKGMPTFLRWVSVTTASRVLQRYTNSFTEQLYRVGGFCKRADKFTKNAATTRHNYLQI